MKVAVLACLFTSLATWLFLASLAFAIDGPWFFRLVSAAGAVTCPWLFVRTWEKAE